MRLGGKRILSWVAIYAIALHVILLGLAPAVIASAPAFDPLSPICHSLSADQASNEVPGKPDLVPGHACEHCNLAMAYAPPVAPHDAVAGVLAPTRVLDVLRPASAAPIALNVASLNLARGPPLPA